MYIHGCGLRSCTLRRLNMNILLHTAVGVSYDSLHSDQRRFTFSFPFAAELCIHARKKLHTAVTADRTARSRRFQQCTSMTHKSEASERPGNRPQALNLSTRTDHVIQTNTTQNLNVHHEHAHAHAHARHAYLRAARRLQAISTSLAGGRVSLRVLVIVVTITVIVTLLILRVFTHTETFRGRENTRRGGGGDVIGDGFDPDNDRHHSRCDQRNQRFQ